MNNLEKYIRNNKSLFDGEPASGHFERLQQKMNRKSGRIIALRWGISIAASIAIVFLISSILHKTEEKVDKMAACETAIDMKLCYFEKMNDVAERIEMLSKDYDPWDRQQLMTDVHNIIEIAYSGFEIEIPEELSEYQARLILSDYYRQNLEGLEMIASEL